MEENKVENKVKRLSVPATILLTVAATLGCIVVARLLYYIIAGV